VVLHRWGTRLGVWSRPSAQTDPLARGKPGIDVAFPLLSLGAHPAVVWGGVSSHDARGGVKELAGVCVCARACDVLLCSALLGNCC
jgi:hypothetical protein